MASLGLSVGLTAASAGANIAIAKKNCEAIGDFNPYQNCIKPCNKFPKNSIENLECIAINRCDDKDEYTVFNGKIVNSGSSIGLNDKVGANTWANLEGETAFDKRVRGDKGAPAGWNTQNQREYNAMKRLLEKSSYKC